MTERDEEIVGRAKEFFIPRGPVGVLLVHGFTGSIADLRPTGEWLAHQGYSVYGVRLAGHGSRPELLSQTTPDDWLASAEAGLMQLCTVARKVVILGDSFGGNIAMELSLRQPGPVAGVILLSTPTTRWVDKIRMPFLPLLGRVHPYHRKRWVTAEMVKSHLAMGKYLKVPIRSYTAMLKFLARQQDNLKQVNCPVLMVYLADDQVVPPANAHIIYRALGAQKKQLYWVRGVYHHPLASPKREAILNKLNEWIQLTTNTQ